MRLSLLVITLVFSLCSADHGGGGGNRQGRAGGLRRVPAARFANFPRNNVGRPIAQVHRLAPIQAAPQPVIEQVARTQFVEAAPIRQAPQLRTPKNIQFDDGTQFINNAPDGEGNYDFSINSPDISIQESGSQRQLTRDEAVNEVRGSVSYTAPNGEFISYTYIADENGYQPSNLPQVHPAIQRGLDLIARVNGQK